MKNALIIGGGPAGCCAAHQLTILNQNYNVTLVEKSNFLGGGCKTLYFGGHPYTFGPRHFLTQRMDGFAFLGVTTIAPRQYRGVCPISPQR